MSDTLQVANVNGLVVTVSVESDEDNSPFDADCYSDEDIAAWRNDEWCYVTLHATVTLHDVVIGEAYLSGVESGTMPEAGDINPLAFEPTYVTDNTVIGGSPAASVADEAIDEAARWLGKLISNDSILATLVSIQDTLVIKE